MDIKTVIGPILEGWGLEMPEGTAEKLGAFLELVLSENEKYNLTAIRDPEEAAVKHIADSLFLFAAFPDLKGKLLDIGCGAGFPGVPAKLWRPELELTAMDSTGKKADFVVLAGRQLGFDVNALNLRAEEAAVPPMRESFDFVTGRAVAPLGVLAELSLPYVRPGGYFLPMKSTTENFEAELSKALPHLKKLGAELQGRREYELPGGGKRQVLIIKKTGVTAAKYPRRYSAIIKEFK